MTVRVSDRALTRRQQYCIAIGILCARYRWKDAKALIRKGMGGSGLPRTFFSEMVIHLSLLLGFPAMLEMLEGLSGRRGTTKDIHRRSQRATGIGLQLLRRIYGNQTEKLLENLRRLQPELPRWIIEDVYGRIFSRRGLTMQEREILNMTILAVQGLERQLHSHIRGALRVGLSPAAVIAVLQRVARSARIKNDRSLNIASALTNSGLRFR